MVVMHDLSSGIAERPCWGAMYGKQAVSEQALAEQAIERLPEGAVVLGDRNFGVFWMAYLASQKQHPVVLLLAVSAYNLVRAVMCLAARRAGLSPRQLSFSFVLDVVNATWPRLMAATSRRQHDAEFERVLEFAAGYKIPQRRRLRSYPRAVWRHRSAFPARKPNSKASTHASEN